MSDSPLEAKLLRLLWCYEIQGFEREYRFALPRQWRADFAFVNERVLVEVDGGQWKPHGGRHNLDADREKTNEAAARGYRVLRFSGAMLDEPDKVADVIRRALGGGNDGGQPEHKSAGSA